jgi:tape measure domain-containing protein
MAGLSIKITADTAGAASALKTLADSSEELAEKLEKANKKLARANVNDFIANQSLTTAALQATRGELGALDASITAYQRKIERLIKDSLAPESEEVKSLQGELAKLQSRRSDLQAQADAQAESEKRVAEAMKAAEEAVKREADVVVKSLDAKTKLEKANIRLASQQDELKDRIRALVESGMKPESAEIKTLEAEYRKLTKEIDENTKKQREQETAVKGALAGLAALGAAVAAAGAFAITSAAKVQDMTAAFEPMLGSADKARELVKRLNQEAVTTPFEIEAINDAVKRLMPAFQGNTDKAVKAFRMIGDTAGGNAQKLDTLTNAYTKVLLKGKTSMEELNMIANAGVPIFTELAATLGVSVSTLTEMSSKGQISADNLTVAFERMTSAGGIFYEGMEKSAFTFNSQLLGLQENIGLAAAAIGEKLLPVAGALVEQAADAVAAFIAWAEEGEHLTDLLNTLGTVIAGTSAALGAFVVVSKGHAVVSAMAGAVKLLMGALTGPAGIAALAVGGIATAIAMYVNYQEKANRAGAIFADQLGTTKNKANELLSEYDKLNPGKALDKKTTEELIRLYPELNGMVDEATAGAKEYAEAIEQLAIKKAVEEANIWIAKLQKQQEEYEKAESAAKKYEKGARENIKRSESMNDFLKAKEFEDAIGVYNGIADDWKKKIETTVTQINTILGSVGKQFSEDYQIIDIPITVTPPKVEPPDAGGYTGKNESELEKILKNARRAVQEYGKSEGELTEAKMIGLNATNSQIEEYRRLTEELQKLKDAEEARKQVEKETAAIEKQTENYLKQLEELHIKNDEIKNDEAQLLELERERAIAEIEASEATDKAKNAALQSLNEYYDAMIKISNEDFDKKGNDKSEKDNLAAFKKRLEEKLDAEKGNTKKRIELLKSGLGEIEHIEGITAEQIASLNKELTKQIAAETAQQKQIRIDTTLQALSAIQDLTNVFGDLAQQAADEKAEREKVRLEAEKAANSQALIDKFNEEVKTEGMTEEEKQRIKKEFLAQYKKNEEEYTTAVEREEEKRKQAAVGAAIADKALSASIAAINSFVAFTGALAAYAELGPIAYIQAGAILAAGLAQQAKIIATPIKAETGGRFMVPDTGGGVDRAYMQVNAGETVEVMPRGEDAYPYVIHNVLMIERRVIYDVVNEGIRSGDIRPWENL